MGRVHVECAKVLKMCLFTTSHTKSLRLDEFEQGQVQAIDQVGSYVKVGEKGWEERTHPMGTLYDWS